jgi:AbrB family looped-hinge helix DNA binding protein
MSRIESKVTSQGQISVPAPVRKRLGIGPGSVLVWEERDGEFVVRRAVRSTTRAVHAALFEGALPTTVADVREGIRRHMREKHARR